MTRHHRERRGRGRGHSSEGGLFGWLFGLVVFLVALAVMGRME